MRVLIAEPDGVLAARLRDALYAASARVQFLDDAWWESWAPGLDELPDVMVLEWALPTSTFDALLARVRELAPALPVLALCVHDTHEGRISALDGGADDCVSKPVHLHEFVARVRALARRAARIPLQLLRFGALSLDPVGRSATLGGQMLKLSAREMSVLEILLRHAGTLVHKDQILRHLGSVERMVSSNAAEVYVHRLRRKLERSEIRIVTLRGMGYCLEAAPTPTQKLQPVETLSRVA